MLAEDAVADTVGLNISSPFGAEGQTATLFSVVLLWLNFAALTALILYPFFKDRIKTYPLVMKLFVMPVYLFSIVFICYIVRVMGGEQALSSFNFRSAVYAAEAGFAFGMCVKF
ncbi:MAG: hypothetical protein IJS67_03230, partial [Clostridia bacterium]|nr:hypothetical protein [Clostridia bacterium]